LPFGLLALCSGFTLFLYGVLLLGGYLDGPVILYGIILGGQGDLVFMFALVGFA